MRYAAFIVLIGAAISGCSSITDPKSYELPERDYSLDPSALVAPNLIYACRGWAGPKVTGNEKIFVDVAFGRGRLEDPDDRPSLSHIAAVEKHAGTVVYKFHFPVARVWIAPSRIPELGNESGVIAIYAVTNLRRYDWFVGVGYEKPYSYLDGATRYAEIGGRVDYKWNSINAISGLLPDLSATVLRQDAGVDYVESMGAVGCID